ncbi:MAG TPA: serine hydrolase domain-containing protein [Frankiaceae bacterium]|jgi:CubicO group peptidase (beta-lactamase class C family)|nr:serine hydrolase domain-containing protein [Frankiaceae bacterium]
MSGLSNAGVQRLADVAASHVGSELVPGLVALVASGDDVHVEALGELSIGGAPVQRDSLFRIASTTKPITGAVTMALVDEGLLSLDEPVTRLLPELAAPRVLRRMDGSLDDTVPVQREITVRDLLTFTFGFGMDFGMFTAATPWPIVLAAMEAQLSTIGPPDPEAAPSADEWIKRFGELPLLTQPGERWLYNSGAQVLAVLCQRAAGASRFDEVLQSRLLQPLGMSQTAFFAADTARLATAYFNSPDGLGVWDPAQGKWSRQPAFDDGAAGLVSTADDLLAFARMFLRGGAPVLSAGSVKEMTRDQLTSEQRAGQEAFLGERSWGLCQSVIISGERAGAFGWDGGLGSSFLVDPTRELVVIVLTQRLFDSPQPPAVHTELQDAAYAALR